MITRNHLVTCFCNLYLCGMATLATHINVTKHRLKFLRSETASVHSVPYQAGPKSREIEETRIGKMLEEEFIKPVYTKQALSIKFVTKEHGTLRFRVDYCKLNTVTIQCSYHNFRMNEFIELLGDAGVCSTLDANSGN